MMSKPHGMLYRCKALDCPLIDVYRHEKRVSEQLASCVRHSLRQVEGGMN